MWISRAAPEVKMKKILEVQELQVVSDWRLLLQKVLQVHPTTQLG